MCVPTLDIFLFYLLTCAFYLFVYAYYLSRQAFPFFFDTI